MCGIAGIVDGRGADTRAPRLARMLSHIQHRGPDGTRAHHDARASLGHNRLAILDLSAAGDQPMFDGACALVYNGEIYNHLDLRAALEPSRARPWRSHCDSETLLAGFTEWGSDVVGRLRGMFAFAIWDAASGRLTCARDPFGKKPLYYWTRDGEFVFASVPEAVVAALDRRPAIDEVGLSGFLLRGHYLPGSSIYGSVRSLPAGHLLEFDSRAGLVRTHAYRRPTFALGDGGFDHDAVQAETARRLHVAVDRRMLSDVPVGVLLSGGVDSSLVSLDAPRQLEAFCATFPGTEADESRYAEQVAAAGNLRLRHVVVAPDDFPALLDRMVTAFAEPFGDLSAIPAFCLFEGLKPYVKVALTGDGGDEVFAGYKDAAVFWARYRLHHEGSGSGPAAALARKLARSKPGLARQAGLGLGVLTLTGSELFLALYREGWTEHWRRRLFRPEAWQATGGDTIERTIAQAFAAAGETDLDRYLNMNLERLSECFLVKIDRAAMAHSIEGRCPFLDLDLFEHAASLPVSALLPRGRRKAVLKDLLARRMGQAFVNRRKSGFTPPLAGWLRTPTAAAWARPALEAPDGYVAALLKPGAVAELLARHQGGEDHSARLWRLLFLNAWHARSYGAAAPRYALERAVS